MKKYEAYIITNTVNGKKYVGITSQGVDLRWRGHRQLVKYGRGTYLHKAIRKHGLDKFTIEHVASSFDNKSLEHLEKILISQHNTIRPFGYNLTIGGEGTNGHKFTLEQRRKLSEIHTGKIISEETKRRMSIASSKRKHTMETKLLLSSIHKARFEDTILREKTALLIAERMRTPEARKKQKENFLKLMEREEFRAKWVGNRLGSKASPELKEKLRQSHLGIRPTKAAIEKMKEAKRNQGFVVLTEEQISLVKLRLAIGDSGAIIAKETGASSTSVCRINKGKVGRGIYPYGFSDGLMYGGC